MSRQEHKLLTEAWKECEKTMAPYILDAGKPLTLGDFSNTLALQKNGSEKSLAHINGVFRVPEDFTSKHRYSLMSVLVKSVTNQVYFSCRGQHRNRHVQLLMLNEKLDKRYGGKVSFEEEAIKYLDLVNGLRMGDGGGGDGDSYVHKICENLHGSVMFHHSMHFADYVRNGRHDACWPVWTMIECHEDSMRGGSKKNGSSISLSLIPSKGRGHSVVGKRGRDTFEETSERPINEGNIKVYI